MDKLAKLIADKAAGVDESLKGEAHVTEVQIAARVDAAAARATVVAYEPVWAIGTGLTASTGDIAQVHASLRAELTQRFGDEGRFMRILYGGSVKPDNARQLMGVADVNGALVGGASLKADDFLAFAVIVRRRIVLLGGTGRILLRDTDHA